MLDEYKIAAQDFIRMIETTDPNPDHIIIGGPKHRGIYGWSSRAKFTADVLKQYVKEGTMDNKKYLPIEGETTKQWTDRIEQAEQVAWGTAFIEGQKKRLKASQEVLELLKQGISPDSIHAVGDGRYDYDTIDKVERDLRRKEAWDRGEEVPTPYSEPGTLLS